MAAVPSQHNEVRADGRGDARAILVAQDRADGAPLRTNRWNSMQAPPLLSQSTGCTGDENKTQKNPTGPAFLFKKDHH